MMEIESSKASFNVDKDELQDFNQDYARQLKEMIVLNNGVSPPWLRLGENYSFSLRKLK